MSPPFLLIRNTEAKDRKLPSPAGPPPASELPIPISLPQQQARLLPPPGISFYSQDNCATHPSQVRSTTLKVTQQWALLFQFCSPSSWFKCSFSHRAQPKASKICASRAFPKPSEPRALQELTLLTPCKHFFCTNGKLLIAFLERSHLLVRPAEDECSAYRALLASSLMNTVDPAENLGSTGRCTAWGGAKEPGFT